MQGHELKAQTVQVHTSCIHVRYMYTHAYMYMYMYLHVHVCVHLVAYNMSMYHSIVKSDKNNRTLVLVRY